MLTTRGPHGAAQVQKAAGGAPASAGAGLNCLPRVSSLNTYKRDEILPSISQIFLNTSALWPQVMRGNSWRLGGEDKGEGLTPTGTLFC
jgi:hypothetical protein